MNEDTQSRKTQKLLFNISKILRVDLTMKLMCMGLKLYEFSLESHRWVF